MAELIKTLTITVNTDKGTISIGKLEEKFKDTTKAAKELERQINKNTGTFGRTENVLKKEIQLRTQLRAATAGDTAEYQKQSLAIMGLESELHDLSNTQQMVANSANKMRDKTGLAGAAAVEIGRTISDSNYGFTAMANNISQLSTLMSTLVVTSGGVAGGFRELWKVLKGPIGIIVVFQIVVALIERVAMKSKEAKESVDSLKNSFGEAAAEIAAYTSILQDSTLPLEEKNKIVKELNDSHKDLNVELNEEGRLTQDSTDKIEKYIEILQKKAKVEFYVTKLKENFNKIAAIENEELGDNLTLLDKVWAMYLNKSPLVVSAKKTVKELENINKEINELTDKINKEGIFAVGGGDDDKSYIASRIREFKEKTFDLLKEEERFRQLGEKAEVKSQLKLIEIKANAAIDAAEIKKNEFIKGEAIRLNNFNIQSKEDEKREVEKAEKSGTDVQTVRNKYIKQRADANKIFNKSSLEAEKEFTDSKLVFTDSYFKQIDAYREEDARKDKLRKENLLMNESEAILAFNASMAESELGKIAIQEQAEQLRHNNEIKRINDEIKERIDANKSYTDLEEKKNIENRKNERQKTKLTKAGEDARLDIINYAANAAIGIAGKGSALGKSIAIAMAIINTKKAITAALGDSEVPAFYRILHATAIGAYGFKQIKDIQAVKLPVSAGAGGGGGAGNVSVSAPDFNVVGQGAGSQLAGAVSSQFGGVIKAYVVSSDVTSAQELDRKINTTSSIG